MKYRYRLVSRCIPGSESYDFYERAAHAAGHEYENEWCLSREYTNLPSAKAQRTRMVSLHYYKGEIEWAIQRQPLNDEWELVDVV